MWINNYSDEKDDHHPKYANFEEPEHAQVQGTLFTQLTIYHAMKGVYIITEIEWYFPNDIMSVDTHIFWQLKGVDMYKVDTILYSF